MPGVYYNPLYRRARPVEADPSADDCARVAAWRALRMNWSAIGRNLGLSEDAVRRRFDPTYQPAVKR